jgi:long-chain fatty acid transport protein
MKHTSKLTLLGAALACGATATQTAQAGGISLYEIGTPDVGLASAGFAARAQDASTLYKNPAGMSRLNDAQLQAGIQVLYGAVQFSPDSKTSPTLGNKDGGVAVGALPGVSLFYVQPLGEKWRVGFGTFNSFGLMATYDKNWVGRYYAQESALVGISFMPSVSYQATDWLSFGASLNAMYGYLNNKVAVNNPGPFRSDGEMKYVDGNWGFGGNGGILLEPAKGTRFGLTYTSPVKLDFADKPTFTGLGPVLGAVLSNPAELSIGMTVPQSVMLGVYQEITDRLALMGDVGWQDWSQFGYVQLGVDSANPKQLTGNLNYQDTWHAALGAQYTFSDHWVGTAGMAYDSSAVNDANRTVVLPMSQAWRFGVGALWQVSENVYLNAAYEFMWAGDMPVDQGADGTARGRVSGGYNDAWFSFFTVNVTWKF